MQKWQMMKKAIETVIEAIVKILVNGDRVELIPVKDGVKVIKIKREEIKKQN